MWLLYEFLYILGYIAYLPGALRRKRLPHAGWRMRLGRYPHSVTEALQEERPVWLHAVSVGEVLAAKPLIRQLEAGPAPLVVSTITPSGQKVLRESVVRRAATIYYPLDLRCCVTPALNRIRPRALVLMESELWPLMLRIAKARNIPVVVVNGRVSPRSFRRYKAMRWWVDRVLNSVDCFLMQSELDAQRLIAIGVDADRVRVAGNLKWDASAGGPPPEAESASLRHRLGLGESEPVWVAGSTHRGEEALFLEVLKQCLKDIRLRLVIAVRHLERLDEVEALVRSHGLRAARASKAAEDWQVLLVDTFGQLPAYYTLADVVSIGGSFIPHGGQNPIEAAALGKPVVFGPHMHNFPEIAETLLAEEAAVRTGNAESLRIQLMEFLNSEPLRAAYGRRAMACVAKHTGATARVVAALRPYVEPQP